MPDLITQIEPLLNKIRNAHDAALVQAKIAEEGARRSLELAVVAGEHVARLKSEIPHGQFGWAIEQAGLTKRTAQRYMRLFKEQHRLGEVDSMREAEALLVSSTGGGSASESDAMSRAIESMPRRHPANQALPLDHLRDDSCWLFTDLADSIRLMGGRLIEPRIIMHEGMVLDGFLRLLAAKFVLERYGEEVEWEEVPWDGELETPEQYVYASNVVRQHLSREEYERAYRAGYAAIDAAASPHEAVPMAYSMCSKVIRRHLTPDQRAQVKADLGISA